jgi:hypothetical protein
MVSIRAASILAASTYATSFIRKPSAYARGASPGKSPRTSLNGMTVVRRSRAFNIPGLRLLCA